MILDPSRGIRTSSPGSPSATTSALRRSVPPAGPRRHEWVGVPADTAPNRFRPRSRGPEAPSGGRPLIPGTVGAEREYDRMWIATDPRMAPTIRFCLASVISSTVAHGWLDDSGPRRLDR